MITRSQMRRQLRAKGGIMNVAPREKFGLGSKIKDRIRKLIPNEIANIAVKAAPFVAPFNPAIAGIMRGVGRFDQRGSISDAFKQGLGTFAAGAGARYLGGQRGMSNITGGGLRGGFTNPLSAENVQKGKALFQKQPKQSNFNAILEDEIGADRISTTATEIAGGSSSGGGQGIMKKATEATIDKLPFTENLPQKVKEKLLVGSVTSGASALYSYFTGEFEPQQPGETTEQYLARRDERVKAQMRGYLDSYYTPLRNPKYAAMTPMQKDRYIDSIVGSASTENMATGGRVGYQTGGISMTNTAAQNRAINNAQRAQNQEQLQKGRDVQKATQELDSYFGKGSSASDPNRQAFITKNFNSMPIQSAAGFNFSGATPDPFNVMGYDSKNRAGIINTIASNYAQERRNQAAPTTSTFNKQASIDAAADREAKAKAYYQALEQKQLETYGRGVKTMPEFIGGDPYKAEAATLGGMNPGAYMDYLLTGDPQDLKHKYYKDVEGIPNPDYDPQFASYDDIYSGSIATQRTPYDVYYEQQLEKDVAAGIPEAERIQRGQVMGMPGAIPTGTTGTMPSRYESYEDALARTKAAMGLRSGGRVGFSDGSNLKIKLKQIGYEDTLLDTMSIKELRELLDSEKGTFTDQGTYREPANMGGIMGMPMGEPRVNQGGITELDYRAKGGFVPVGIKEKADDVPAMLSKNEFVFTADAVRGAGNGSIENGAQKMYDTMKNLERRVT